MTKIGIVFLVLFVAGQVVLAQEKQQPKLIDFDEYYNTYPYMSYRHAAFTFDSEFEWPEGFHRLDSASLTPYQYWVSYMPMWTKTRPVGSYSKGILYQPEEVARPFNLPWRTVKFHHTAVAYQILTEYLLIHQTWFDLAILPDKGDTLTFKRWLGGKMVFDRRDSLYFLPDEPKEATEREFNHFFTVIAQNTDYHSFIRNCDSVAEADLRPGDMLVGHDEKGRKGMVHIIMCVAVNDQRERLFIIGTGCEEACDFHIPLFNDKKDYPWITLETMKSLVPEEFAQQGFFRFKAVN